MGGFMDIFKAIKKEKKFLKHFYIFMGIIGMILPLAVYITGIKSLFFSTFLVVIEVLILSEIIIKINHTSLKFSCINNRFKFKFGMFNKENVIFCDKVKLVHTEKMEEDMEIIIVTSVNFKNRGLRLVNNKFFFRRYPGAIKDITKIYENNRGELLYYQVIRRGGLKKYLLLDSLYKNCVKSVYTADCIENIKIARGQTLV